MAEKNKKYYSLERILKEKATYNIIIGERSNGKTFSVQSYGLEQYCKTGNQMALVRRWNDDYTGKRGSQTFEALVQNGLVSKFTNGEWTDIKYQSSRWYLAKYDSDLEKLIVKDEPFCYAFSLNTSEHDKSTSYPRVKNVLFDEFLTRGMYLTDEFTVFMNVLSTIIRDRDDVTIFMCGNTVNQFSPYFTEMGLTNIRKMKAGDIDIYSYGESLLKVAVEYCDTAIKNKGKKSDKYFAFNNPKLNMITNGSWELALYPHLPKKYNQLDIMSTYYIQFSGIILQCEIVGKTKENSYFTYIHRKTTEFKYPDKDMIYSTTFSDKPNWSRKITKPRNEYERKIWYFFSSEKVFYQDNEVGEIVRNYIQWCKTEGVEL